MSRYIVCGYCGETVARGGWHMCDDRQPGYGECNRCLAPLGGCRDDNYCIREMHKITAGPRYVCERVNQDPAEQRALERAGMLAMSANLAAAEA